MVASHEAGNDNTSPTIAVRTGRGPPAIQILSVAAVHGDGFQADDLAELLGEPVGAMLADVAALLDRGRLVIRDGNLAFRDRLLLEQCYAATPEPIRRCLHRRIGLLLLERGGAPAEAAEHLLDGARPATRTVLADLDRAVRELTGWAPEEAATVALRTFELTAPADREWPTRGAAAAEAMAAAGHLEPADRLARRVVASGRATHADDARLRLLLVSIQLTRADAASALAELDAIPTPPALPAPLAARADVARLYGLMVAEQVQPASELATEILAGSRACESEVALAAALAVLARSAWVDGRPNHAVALARAASRRIERAEHGQLPGADPHLMLGVMLACLSRYDEAAPLLTGLTSTLATLGRPPPAATLAHRARLALRLGDVTEAAHRAEGARRFVAAQPGSPDAHLVFATLAEVALLRGQVEEAARCLTAFREAPVSRWPDVGWTCRTWVAARVAEARDGANHALQLLADVYDNLSRAPSILVEQPAAGAWLVRLAVAGGTVREAEAVTAIAEQLAAQSTDAPGLIAAAEHARGVLDRDVDALTRAGQRYPEASARAAAHEDAAAVLLEDGDVSRAGEHLRSSLRQYDLGGAERDAGRLRACMRRHGVRTGGHSRRTNRAATGWNSLTDTERRVARVIADGHTNREAGGLLFLSPHTVDYHLRSIYRKLDVRSRVELPRIVLEHESPATTSPDGEIHRP
jgi:DNA-binding CsgD family transcriptional regulator/tetratricopeptide (TPR) repeat protein